MNAVGCDFEFAWAPYGWGDDASMPNAAHTAGLIATDFTTFADPIGMMEKIAQTSGKWIAMIDVKPNSDLNVIGDFITRAFEAGHGCIVRGPHALIAPTFIGGQIVNMCSFVFGTVMTRGKVFVAVCTNAPRGVSHMPYRTGSRISDYINLTVQSEPGLRDRVRL